MNKIPAHVNAHATGKWAETIFRALNPRTADRWKFVWFRGANKGKFFVLGLNLKWKPTTGRELFE